MSNKSLLEQTVKEKCQEFDNILNQINGLESKTKALWRQIYSYALVDRENAFEAFQDLFVMMKGNSSNHAIHGQNAAKYIERMQKSNDQILKLVELIGAAEQEQEEKIDPDDLYNSISNAVMPIKKIVKK